LTAGDLSEQPLSVYIDRIKDEVDSVSRAERSQQYTARTLNR